MLRLAKDLKGYKLSARDGDIGKAEGSTSMTEVGRFDISLPIQMAGWTVTGLDFALCTRPGSQG